MIAVIFEVWPAEGQRDTHLDIAAGLRPLLDEIDRFESLNEPGKMLSLSFWRNENAVQKWRALDEHRGAQRVGRGHVFRDYRLRIAGVVRDYGLNERDEAPADSRVVNDAIRTIGSP
jgi:heme-degrading monooxygenase HmoA